MDYHQLFEQSPNPYMVLDRDLRYVDMNQAYLDVTGRSREQLLGVPVFDAFPGDGTALGDENARMLRASLRKVLDTGKPDTLGLIRYGIERQSAHGPVMEDRYWSATHTPLVDAEGRTTRVLQHTVDVTELQRLKEALRAATMPQDEAARLDRLEGGVFQRAQKVQAANTQLEEQRTQLMKMFEQAPGFMAYLHGPEHRFMLVNQAYSQLIGDRGLVGLTLVECLPEAAEQGYLRLLDEVFASGKPFLGQGMRLELQRTPERGVEQIVVDFVYQPVLDAEGRVTGIVVQGIDMTAQAAAQQELARYHADLTELVEERTQALNASEAERRAAEAALLQAQKLEAVGKLTGGIAHDFNNLLQVVGANLDLALGHQGLSAPVKERLDAAGRAVRRGARLVSQLLAFARKQPLNPTVFDAGDRLQRLGDLLQRTLGEGTAITLDLDIDPAVGNVEADPVQFDNSVLNLAINARDAIRGIGRVSIRCRRADGASVGRPGEPMVEVVVRDTGRGMPQEVLDRIFEPFFTTKQVGRGSGLGMPMVYGFMRQSGGDVRVESTEGEGTTVTLSLPLSDKPATPVAPESGDARPGHGERVMVVEDDDAVRAGSVQMLRTLGYDVCEAADAASARALIDRGIVPDLLFTDVVMPGPMRSTQLAAYVRARHPQVQVLFTSGFAEEALARDGGLESGDELLEKPYRMDVLAQRVRQLLDSQVPKGPANPLRILLVDDCPDERFLTKAQLQSLGHEVVAVAMPDEALARLAEGGWDVLMTDVELPLFSGIELARKVRERDIPVRIVFVSGHDPATLLERGAMGAILPKPFDATQLATALGAAEPVPALH
ncbi:response regulator [Lysobacter olei]